MDTKQRASNQMVAERAGVSAMTVSRVVQGRKHLVSPATYERVLAAMEELNYVPVRLSMQNRHVATHTLGLVPFYRKASRSVIDSFTYSGVCEAAASHGYDIFTLLRREADWLPNSQKARFLDRRNDGFIFISLGCGEWQIPLQALVENEIPTVVCYRRDVPEGVAWVDPDNEGIIELAVDCLRRHGHEGLAYLSSPNPAMDDEDLLADLSGNRDLYDDDVRQMHFSRLMREANQGESSGHWFSMAATEWPLNEEAAGNLFESGATGVIVGNDYLAVELWDLATKAGLKVPEDLSIVSVDNHQNAAIRGLTSVGFGYHEVGKAAVEAWLELNSGKPAAQCCRVVPVSLVERASVAAPRSR